MPEFSEFRYCTTLMRRLRMRHKIYFILTILLIILLSAPCVVGLIFKYKYFQFIDLINKENRVKIEVLQYEEGWWHSYAKVRITFVDSDITNFSQANLSEPVSFALNEKINHGPIVYDHIKSQIQ